MLAGALMWAAKRSLANVAFGRGRGGGERPDAARLPLPPGRADRPQLRPGIPIAADAQADAGSGGFRRQVHDRLPGRVSRQLVRGREAVAKASGPEAELL